MSNGEHMQIDPRINYPGQDSPSEGAQVDPRIRYPEAQAIPEPQQLDKAQTLEAITSLINNGITLGLSDEIYALTGAVKDKLSGQEFGESYDNRIQEARGPRDQFARENPKTAAILETVPGFVSGVVGAAKMAGTQAVKSLSSPLAQFAASAAPVGAIAGAGYADPSTELSLAESLSERSGAAATGAAIAGTLGVAIPPAAKAIGTVADEVAIAMKDTFRGAPTKASRKLSQAFANDQVSPAKALRNKLEMGEQASLSDVGGSEVLSLADDLANKPGAPRNDAIKFHKQRKAGQRDRLIQGVKEHITPDAENFHQARDTLTEQMTTTAAPLYDEAYRVPINNKPMKRFSTHPKVAREMNSAIKAIEEDITIPKELRTNLDPENPTMIVWDKVKKQLGEKEQSLLGKGKKEAAKPITAIRKLMTTELKEQNSLYEEALKVWSDGSGEREAMELGQDIFKDTAKDLHHAKRMMENMTDSEKEFFRLGVGDEMVRIIQTANDTQKGAPGQAMLTKIFGSPAKRDAIKDLVGGDDFRFRRLFQAEGKFNENANIVTGGSQTSARQAQRDAARFDVGAAAELADVATKGTIGGRLRGVQKSIGRIFSDVSEDPRISKELSDKLYTTDVKEIKTILAEMEETGYLLPPFAKKMKGLENHQAVKWLGVENNYKRLNKFIGGLTAVSSSAAASPANDTPP